MAFTAAPGGVGDGSDGVFGVRAVECDGSAGQWIFDLAATCDGATFSGQVVADIAETTLSGPFTLTGNPVGGGISIPQRGSGTITIVAEGDTSTLTFASESWMSGQTGGGSQGPGVLTARRATRDECA